MKGDKEWACFPCKQKSVHSKWTEANHMDFLLQFFLFIFWVSDEGALHRIQNRENGKVFVLKQDSENVCLIEHSIEEFRCVNTSSISYHLTLYFVFNIYFVDWHDEYDMGRKWMKWNFFVFFCILIFCNGKHAAKQHEDRRVITFLTDDEVLHCNYLAHVHIHI